MKQKLGNAAYVVNHRALAKGATVHQLVAIALSHCAR